MAAFRIKNESTSMSHAVNNGNPPLTSDALNNAAELLTAPGALMQLTLEEARIVASYMEERHIPSDTTFIREGDAGDNGFMALLLDGEVVVESIVVSRTEPVTIKVLGPGSLVGEVGLVDQEPRSASCTTSTDVVCAILTRDAIEALIDSQPRVGAKLLLAISVRLAQRLRDNARKLRLYAKLAQAMSMEMSGFIRGQEGGGS